MASISNLSSALPQTPVGVAQQRIHQDVEQLAQALQAQPASPVASTSVWGQGFDSVLARVDAKEQAASQRVQAVERGESDDMVGAMLASQDASLSFSMLMQVRNKVAGAVDELIKLQL